MQIKNYAVSQLQLATCDYTIFCFIYFCRKTNARNYLRLHLHHAYDRQFFSDYQIFSHGTIERRDLFGRLWNIDSWFWIWGCSLGGRYLGIDWTPNRWQSKNFNVFYFQFCKFCYSQNFLRPFREHHIDPTSITRHDWIETNGDNFMVALPILVKVTWIFFSCSRAEIQVEYPFCAYLFLCSIFVAITNQVRPWKLKILEFHLKFYFKFRFISGLTRTLDCLFGSNSYKTIT